MENDRDSQEKDRKFVQFANGIRWKKGVYYIHDI